MTSPLDLHGAYSSSLLVKSQYNSPLHSWRPDSPEFKSIKYLYLRDLREGTLVLGTTTTSLNTQLLNSLSWQKNYLCPHWSARDNCRLEQAPNKSQLCFPMYFEFEVRSLDYSTLGDQQFLCQFRGVSGETCMVSFRESRFQGDVHQNRIWLKSGLLLMSATVILLIQSFLFKAMKVVQIRFQCAAALVF